jgi:hypothetical protein
MSNLVEFAEKELNLLLAKCEDEEGIELQKRMNSGVLDVVKAFSNAGHSGFSASYALGLINRLLNWKPITHLTGEDDEWEKVDYGGDDITFQNKRCPSVFKNAEGQAYCVEAKMFSEDNGKTWYTSRDSTVEVVFPYNVPTYPEQVLINKEPERNKILGEIFDLMVSLGVDGNIELTEETSIDEIFSRKNDEILESKIQNKYNINRLLFKVSEAHYMWELINLVLNSDRGDKNEEA